MAQEQKTAAKKHAANHASPKPQLHRPGEAGPWQRLPRNPRQHLLPWKSPPRKTPWRDSILKRKTPAKTHRLQSRRSARHREKPFPRSRPLRRTRPHGRRQAQPQGRAVRRETRQAQPHQSRRPSATFWGSIRNGPICPIRPRRRTSLRSSSVTTKLLLDLRTHLTAGLNSIRRRRSNVPVRTIRAISPATASTCRRWHGHVRPRLCPEPSVQRAGGADRDRCCHQARPRRHLRRVRDYG